MDRRRFLTKITGVVPLTAGCTSGGGGGAQGTTATSTETRTATASTETTVQQQVDETIVMKGTTFQPLKAEVATGATVKWVNKDGFTHDVTAAQFHDTATSWEFSKTLSGGQSTTFTFQESGVYEYYCTIHGKGTMCGAVLVGEATLPESLPCSPDNGGGYGGGGYG